jgi:hypothetical protein
VEFSDKAKEDKITHISLTHTHPNQESHPQSKTHTQHAPHFDIQSKDTRRRDAYIGQRRDGQETGTHPLQQQGILLPVNTTHTTHTSQEGQRGGLLHSPLSMDSMAKPTTSTTITTTSKYPASFSLLSPDPSYSLYQPPLRV